MSEVTTRDVPNKNGDIVAIKLTSGDVIIAHYVGVDDQSGAVMFNDPLVVTSVSGYILLTDFAPFLTPMHEHPQMMINPDTMIYIEPIGQRLADYYDISIKHRDQIRGDMDDIIQKSYDLIASTIAKHNELEQPNNNGPQQGVPLSELLDDGGEESPKEDEPTSGAESIPEGVKVIDFAKVLREATKKKDPLN